MGLDIDRVLHVDMAASDDDEAVRARYVLRTARLAGAFAADVTELRQFLDELGILTPSQCASYPHAYGDDMIAHYLDLSSDPAPQLDYFPSLTVCRVNERQPDMLVRGWQDECTDVSGLLHIPHCIWCVIKAVIL